MRWEGGMAVPGLFFFRAEPKRTAIPSQAWLRTGPLVPAHSDRTERAPSSAKSVKNPRVAEGGGCVERVELKEI